jgi:hypothetical protein
MSKISIGNGPGRKFIGNASGDGTVTMATYRGPAEFAPDIEIGNGGDAVIGNAENGGQVEMATIRIQLPDGITSELRSLVTEYQHASSSCDPQTQASVAEAVNQLTAELSQSHQNVGVVRRCIGTLVEIGKNTFVNVSSNLLTRLAEVGLKIDQILS